MKVFLVLPHPTPSIAGIFVVPRGRKTGMCLGGVGGGGAGGGGGVRAREVEK